MDSDEKNKPSQEANDKEDVEQQSAILSFDEQVNVTKVSEEKDHAKMLEGRSELESDVVEYASPNHEPSEIGLTLENSNDVSVTEENDNHESLTPDVVSNVAVNIEERGLGEMDVKSEFQVTVGKSDDEHDHSMAIFVSEGHHSTVASSETTENDHDNQNPQEENDEDSTLLRDPKVTKVS